MAFLLNFALAFGTLIAVSDSACKLQKLHITNPRLPPKGCFHEGELHPFFSTWESDNCDHCLCYRHGMECCNHNKTAVGYNPKMCVAYFVKELCTFEVVRIKNHSIPCPFKIELNSDSTDSSDSPDNDNSNTKENYKDKSNSSPQHHSPSSSRDKSASADIDDWENWDAEDYAEFYRSLNNENEYKSESYKSSYNKK